MSSFSAGVDQATVIFQLKPKPKDRISVRFTLDERAKEGGAPVRKDFVVVKPRSGDRVVFEAGQETAELTLQRVNTPETPRGLGDRVIEVGFLTDDRITTGAATRVLILVPDPKSELSWSVDPPGTLDRRSPPPPGSG